MKNVEKEGNFEEKILSEKTLIKKKNFFIWDQK